MRHGRGFPLGTQYQSLWRTVPSNPLSGSGSMSLTGAGSLTVVSGTVFESAGTAEHRFRSVQVPELADLEAVQRHLQRNLDEIARAVNPIRSIPDGGTGLVEVTTGALMYGTGSESMATLPPGAPGQVLGLVAGLPAWVAAGGGAGGEANTGSNVGTAGVGVYDSKILVDLQFRKLNPASPRITVTLDAANKKIDFDVVVGAVANTVCAGDDARLSNARVPTGPAGGVLAGTYPDPTFAEDMATQAELDAAILALAVDTRWDPISDISAASSWNEVEEPRAACRPPAIELERAAFNR